MANEKLRPNITVVVKGKPKSGKTHLYLTFPVPMVVFSFDIGIEIVLKKFALKAYYADPTKSLKDEIGGLAGNDVLVMTYPVPIMDTVKGVDQQAAIHGIHRKFLGDFKVAVDIPEVKSLAVDTYTAVYEHARIARAKELDVKIIPREQYGEVYARMRSNIHRARLSGKNLVLTHYLRDKFVDGVNTGQQELDGWRYCESEVDLVLEVARGTKPAAGGKTKNVVNTTITDNRYDLDLNGVTIENASYDTIMAVLGV